MDVKKFTQKKAALGIFNDVVPNGIANQIEPNCRIMGLTRGQFSLIDLVYSVLKKIGPSDVYIVTWSAGIKDVNNVKWMMDSSLIKKVRLITDHSYKTRQKKYAQSVEQLFGVENILTSEIHAKFVLICNDDYKISIRTSMNLNANKTCESFELDEGDEIFDFYYSFISHLEANQVKGFVQDSQVANKTLDLFFFKTEKSIKGWSEL
jgi:hypothetical protein